MSRQPKAAVASQPTVTVAVLEVVGDNMDQNTRRFDENADEDQPTQTDIHS
jgi:hypothetical protein